MLPRGVPNLLVAGGLLLFVPRLGSSRTARVGLWLAIAGLAVSGVIDLIIGALGAPFFIPLVGVGLLLLASGNREKSQFPQHSFLIFLSMGISLLVGFTLILIPLDVFDSISGYRIYGLLVHFIPGILWAWLGLNFLKWDVPNSVESVLN